MCRSEWVTERVSDKVTYWAVWGQLKRIMEYGDKVKVYSYKLWRIGVSIAWQDVSPAKSTFYASTMRWNTHKLFEEIHQLLDVELLDPFLSSLVLCCVSSSRSLVSTCACKLNQPWFFWHVHCETLFFHLSTFLESSITTPWARLRRRLLSFGLEAKSYQTNSNSRII